MMTFGTLKRGSLAVGLIASGVCVAGLLLDRSRFFEGYLQAFGYWMAISIGCLGLLLLHRLTGGMWGKDSRTMFVAGVRMFPLMAILFVPIAFGMTTLYSWTNQHEVAEHAVLSAKQAYLNIPAFLIRTALYFIVWILFGMWSTRKAITPRNLGGSALGLLLLVITSSFAAFDWFMSLEPEWFSSMYGGIFIAGAIVSTFSMIVVLSNLFREGFSVERSHDYGKFMLMGVMLWAYLSFSQYLIIWSAQLPEEMVWYHHRRLGIWPVVGLSLIVLQFALPFCLLLSRQLKKTKYLMYVALLILAMRFVDLWWWVGPAFHPNQTVMPLWALVATAAIGGLWLSGFAHSMMAQMKAGRQGA